MHERLAYLIKHNRLVQWVYRVVMSAVFKTMGLFVPIDPKLVLLSSYGGRQYSDSPKVLYEAMRKDERFRDFRYVWAFEHPENIQIEGAEKVKIDSLKYFRTALAAKVWITNVNIERGLTFKKRWTVYLNTWHGTGPKKGGNAVKGRKDYDFSYVDIVCCDGQYARNEMVKWFNAKEENLLWCGRPREDELFEFTSEDAQNVRAELGIPEDKKVLLYMPTWREYGNRDLNTQMWEKALADSCVMLVRSHHFAKGDKNDWANKDFWRDVSSYPNVNRLYLIADVLISDYSSAFFDYGLLGKPMICYAYDYEAYENSNGLLMDLKAEFPRGIKTDETQVIAELENMFSDYATAAKEAKVYCDSYVSHPGNATRACIDRIWEIMNQK